MDGSGTLLCKDGKTYKGEHLKDKKHGHGLFVWPDGKKYHGQWKEGKQDGLGIFMDNAGTKKHGQWKAGKRTAWITPEEFKKQGGKEIDGEDTDTKTPDQETAN